MNNETIEGLLTDVAEAIRNKEGTTEPIQANEFDTRINNIESINEYFTNTIGAGSGNTSGFASSIKKLPTFSFYGMSTAYMFRWYRGEEIDLSKFNTSNTVDMDYTFEECQSIKNLDLSNFNTDKVTSMYSMFNGCESLLKLDLGNFNTTNVTTSSL